MFITLTAFLFHVSPFIYQCSYRAAKKFCWNLLFLPLSTAFSFSNWHYFYIPWLSINSTKRKSLFESKSLSLVLLRIWFTLGARMCLFSTKNCPGIGGLSHVKVPGVNGLNVLVLCTFVSAQSNCFTTVNRITRVTGSRSLNFCGFYLNIIKTRSSVSSK